MFMRKKIDLISPTIPEFVCKLRKSFLTILFDQGMNGWHDGIVPMGPAWNDTFCEATETSAHSSAPPPVKRKKPTDVLHLSLLFLA